MAIPKLIWQTYKSQQLPTSAIDCVNSWVELNEDWQHNLLDDVQIAAFIASNFDQATYRTFIELPLGVMRADMWRYAVLYIHGGVYADIDTQCLVPINEWPLPSSGVLVALENSTHFCQWCIASQPAHPLFKLVVEMIVDRWSKGVDLSNPNVTHHLTGPGIWTEAIARYTQSKTTAPLQILETLSNQSSDLTIENESFFNGKKVTHLFGSQVWQHDGNYNSWPFEAMLLNQRYAAKPALEAHWEFVHQDQNYNVVLKHSETGSHIELNQQAASVLSYCDGTVSAGTIIEKVKASQPASPDSLAEEIWGSFEELKRLRVINY